MGRIINYFGGLFQEVTCLEPDPGRIALARDTEKWGRLQTIHFVQDRFGALNDSAESFDAISCIQVVQHIPDADLKDWLAKMHLLLKPSGVLILATKHRLKDEFRLEDGNVVSKQKFDENARNPAGQLSVRAFRKETLIKYATQAGFTELSHGFASYDSSDFPDSQYIVVGKKKAEGPPPEVPLRAIHITAFIRGTKVRQRRACKKVCKGKKGLTPGDFFCP